MNIKLLLSISFCLVFGKGVTQNKGVSNYFCHYVNVPVVIDGFQDSCWMLVPWSEDFKDIVSSEIPFFKTAVKLLWDSNFVYVLARMEENDVWANLTEHDEITYWDNDFEVFIDADGDAVLYQEIEVNAYNQILDLMMVEPYRVGGAMVIEWDMKSFKSAVRIEGTLNDNKDQDTCWWVEMAIPIAEILFRNTRNFPQIGDCWRINFSRVQWEVEKATSGDTNQMGTTGYKKKRNELGEIAEEHNWVWCQQGAVNMHQPEYWGGLIFCNGQEMEVNSYTDVKINLFKVWEKVRQIPFLTEDVADQIPNQYGLRLTDEGFIVFIKKENDTHFVNQDGKYWKIID